MRRALLSLALVLLALTIGFGTGQADAPKKDAPPRFSLPPGFVIEKVAGPPLVRYPLFACLDDRGRLFVAEGTGTNLPGPELLKQKKQLGRITMLEDTDGDGVFDKATTFADDLTFPTGSWPAATVPRACPLTLSVIGPELRTTVTRLFRVTTVGSPTSVALSIMPARLWRRSCLPTSWVMSA